MKKVKILLLVIFALFCVGALGLGGFYLINRNQGTKPIGQVQTGVVKFPKNPKRGDPGYQEVNTTIVEDENTKFSGILQQIYEGTIDIDNNGTPGVYELGDEIAIQCTTQNLDGADELDLSKVIKVVLSTSSELKEKVPEQQPVFLLATLINGQPVVHTVAIPDSVCPE